MSDASHDNAQARPLLRNPGAWLIAKVRARPELFITGGLDGVTGLLSVAGTVAVLSQIGWVHAAAVMGAEAMGGLGSVLSNVMTVLATVWRLAMAGPFALFAHLGWEQVSAPPARVWADSLLLLLVLSVGVGRSLWSMMRLGVLSKTTSETGMAAYLRRRLDAVYNTDPRLAERARDQRIVARDAGLLAPWCAKFMSFQSEARDPEEVELDRNWLKRTIVLNVDLQFPELPAHQTVAAKGWASELVLAEMVLLAEKIQRASRRGRARLIRAGRILGVGAVLLVGALGVDAVLAMFSA